MVASGIQVAQSVGFYIVAAMMVLFAVQVVASRNVVHAALALVMVMAGAAALYLLLAAEFVAVTQVLVYIGAVMVLFLFGVMLTRAKHGIDTDLNNKGWMFGIPVAMLMLGVTGWAVIDGWKDTTLPEGNGPIPTSAVSDSIFKPYLLPFWALSFVLLIAVIGAIVLARKD
ncbi:MAG TPA: NADH-quinone oxidoreductase subunit J [Ilumatobacteraceae bacterium]|nr:NADH-quinone oxidoreductase subunit J [Ilumatobacteraceae bacterium]